MLSSVKPSGFMCACVREALALGTPRGFEKITPNPEQSANMVNSLRNGLRWAELPRGTCAFTSQGKLLGSDPSARPRPLARALEGVGGEVQFHIGNGGNWSVGREEHPLPLVQQRRLGRRL